jgi:hypothetical protein
MPFSISTSVSIDDYDAFGRHAFSWRRHCKTPSHLDPQVLRGCGPSSSPPSTVVLMRMRFVGVVYNMLAPVQQKTRLSQPDAWWHPLCCLFFLVSFYGLCFLCVVSCNSWCNFCPVDDFINLKPGSFRVFRLKLKVLTLCRTAPSRFGASSLGKEPPTGV